MHHDAIIVKLATIEAEAKVLKFENARLQSQMTKDFDPNLITYSIAVGRVLFNLKDAFVDQMKRLHESYTYQFLERRPFAYDDSTVAMLEAWMANNMVNRLQGMEQIGNQVEQFNVDPKPLENSITLHRKDHPEAFFSLDQNGTMTFALTGKIIVSNMFKTLTLSLSIVFNIKFESTVKLCSRLLQFEELVFFRGRRPAFNHDTCAYD